MEYKIKEVNFQFSFFAVIGHHTIGLKYIYGEPCICPSRSCLSAYLSYDECKGKSLLSGTILVGVFRTVPYAHNRSEGGMIRQLERIDRAMTMEMTGILSRRTKSPGG